MEDERIARLKNGEAVVVNVSKTRGAYEDPVATWAEEHGLLTYCGDSTRSGHKQSTWFNPHHGLLKDHGRGMVCDKFEAEVLPSLDLSPLKGRALGCWCYPKRCHCDAIAAKVNEPDFGIGHNSQAHEGALEDIASRARLALEEVSLGVEQTMEGWLAYGSALNEGRAMFPSDEQFGQWVRETQLAAHASKDERTAAMWAAANLEDFHKTKEANPRVRTVRGLHTKWKEEQKSTDVKNFTTAPSQEEHADAMGVSLEMVEGWELDRQAILADPELSKKMDTFEGYQEAKVELKAAIEAMSQSNAGAAQQAASHAYSSKAEPKFRKPTPKEHAKISKLKAMADDPTASESEREAATKMLERFRGKGVNLDLILEDIENERRPYVDTEYVMQKMAEVVTDPAYNRDWRIAQILTWLELAYQDDDSLMYEFNDVMQDKTEPEFQAA